MEKMMKKLMFALIAAVCCSSLMANVLIYDYAASFKRINVTGPVKVTVNYSGDRVTYNLDSPKVVSDKFTGYMVIGECVQCGGNTLYGMENSADTGYKTFVVPGNYAVVYIKRNGGNFKYGSGTYQLKNSIYRAIGRFYVGMFGAKASNLIGNFTDAEGFLSYRINSHVSPSKTSNPNAGFLGIGSFDPAILDWWKNHKAEALVADYDTVDHAGFGKVYLKETKSAVDCWTPTQVTTSCWRVKNLSGSMLGGFVYAGPCHDFLFDVCTKAAIQYAPISGTFTLKLNNGLSFNDSVASFSAAEDIILEKMGATTKVGRSTVIDYSKLFADPAETTEFEDNVGDDLYDAPSWSGAARN